MRKRLRINTIFSFQRTLVIGVILLLSALIDISVALTLNKSEEYYLVAPNNAKNIRRAVRNASHLKGKVGDNEIKAMATHHGTYKYKYGTDTHQNRCYIAKLTVNFDSKITLPKIDMNAQKYTDKTLEKFKEYVQELDIHEKQHRKIHMKYLQRTINELRTINKNSTAFKTCKDLRNHIRQEFRKASEIIQRENTKFDCQEYGRTMGLNSCKNYRSTITSNQLPQTQRTKKSDSSSLTQGGENDVKSYKDKDKPDEKECDGQLIEPFKGKFYCVPTGSYSEL